MPRIQPVISKHKPQRLCLVQKSSLWLTYTKCCDWSETDCHDWSRGLFSSHSKGCCVSRRLLAEVILCCLSRCYSVTPDKRILLSGLFLSPLRGWGWAGNTREVTAGTAESRGDCTLCRMTEGGQVSVVRPCCEHSKAVAAWQLKKQLVGFSGSQEGEGEKKEDRGGRPEAEEGERAVKTEKRDTAGPSCQKSPRKQPSLHGQGSQTCGWEL